MAESTKKTPDISETKSQTTNSEPSSSTRHLRIKHHHRGGIIWGLVIIFIGLVLLMNNLGWLPWSIWSQIWRFWPVLIVLAGLHMILGRTMLAGFLLGLFTILILAVISYLIITGTQSPLNQNLPAWWPQINLNIQFGPH